MQKRAANAQILQFLDRMLNENGQNLEGAAEKLQNFVRRTKTYDVRSNVAELKGRTEKLEDDRLVLEEKLQLLSDLDRMVERGSLASREDLTVEQSIPGLSTLADAQLSQQLGELNSMLFDLRRVERSNRETTEAVQSRIDRILC